MELTEVTEKRSKLATDMQALLAKARDEKRELTSEEETQFDKMDGDYERFKAQEKRLLRVAEFDNPTGRRAEPVQPSQETRASQETRGNKKLDVVDGIRSWLLNSAHKGISEDQRQAVQRLGIQLGSKEMTFRLPSMAIPSVRFSEAREWEERALSTLSGSSPVDGSYTVQNEMMRPLEEALLAFGGARQRATVLRTDTGANLPIPTDNDTSNKGEIIDENTQVNEKDVTFGQMTLGSYKYSSKMIRVSVELLQDASFPLGPYLGRKLGQRLGRITNDHFTTSNGSTQPNGVVTAATASGVTLAAQTPTYAELVSAQHSVDPAYRENAAWMFADSMLAEIKKIVDASTGRPIWLPNMVGGAPDTILGDPYVINQSMAAAAGSGSGKSILYGDLSKYHVRDVRDVTLVIADQLFAAYHQIAFLAFSRHDGDLLDAGTHPVKYVANHS